MKRNNNQWAKYVAVVLTFMIMAGFFLLGAKAEVKATEGMTSEAGESVSGGNAVTEEPEMTVADVKGILIKYDLVYEDATWKYEKSEDTILPDSDGSYWITEIIPEKEGYYFVGWTRKSDAGEEIYCEGNFLGDVDSLMDGSSIILTAQWEEILADWSIGVEYILGADDATWEAEYEKEIKPISGSYFIDIPAPDPVRPGYEFVGWTKENDAAKYKAGGALIEISGKDTNESTQIVFTAEWKEMPYLKVTYLNNNETVSTEKVYRTDETGSFSLKFPDVSNKEGYNFIGWQCNNGITYNSAEVLKWADFANISEATFTAQWEWDGKSILANATFILNPETAYTLSEGNWIVSKDGESDGYSYISSDNEMPIYVGTEGNYTFTKN